ncbi:MAG: UDP-N-acetylmuramate:L-alanyl-gamma-D-glutamyl-meso-diaminopimelate ligase [Vicinamibacterales bacterium]
MTYVHFIGICGTAMATLAALLKQRGMRVRGSDEGIYPPMSDFLEAEGIEILPGYSADHVTQEIGLVIIGNAISRGNPELEAVLDRKIRYCSLPEAIRDHFLWGARSIVIAGTHGKTTTTAMTGWLLTSAGADPSVLAGGVALNFGTSGSSYRVGGGRDFVIEGDEYDSAFFDKTAKFLKYLPDIAVVGNVEFDHADIYEDLDAVRLSFRRLVNLIPERGLLLLGSDSDEAMALADGARCRVETFGLGESADWQGTATAFERSGTRFTVRHRGRTFGSFYMPVLGAHNVKNALAATAVASAVGIDSHAVGEAFRRFRGVKRRLEILGEIGGVTVFDDFAHHPTAVAETLRALRQARPGARLRAVFEPRSATACRKVFHEQFVAAFSEADDVLIAPVYRTKLAESERLSTDSVVSDLRRCGRRARSFSGVDAIVDALVAERQEGDAIVLMSNGGFGGINGKLLSALRAASSPEGR